MHKTFESSFLSSDLEDLDFIICTGLLHEINNPKEFLRDIYDTPIGPLTPSSVKTDKNRIKVNLLIGGGISWKT